MATAGTRPATTTNDDQPLLLSVDFEDWHQLVRRRVGVRQWEQAGPALVRQTAAMLTLFEQLSIHATFFVLGMAARAHPELLAQVVAGGHEIGCHGDAHRPVHSQTATEFAADLRAARATIESIAGKHPAGYRAPAFSITRACGWAYDVLTSEGFRYDASEHDSPRIRGRLVAGGGGPHTVETAHGELWEFPVAVWRAGRVRIPVGGASYWGLLPAELVLRGLDQAGPMAGLYLHPHELDPEPLDPLLPPDAGLGQRAHGKLRAAQRNLARRRASDVLRTIAGRYRLIPYGEAHAELSDGPPARP